MDVLRTISTRVTPQRKQAEPNQVRNSAGGYTFEIDDVTRLRRFLNLGVDGGAYYASAKDLAFENFAVLESMAASDPETLVATIVDVSARGAAPRQAPTLFALAYAASRPETASLALAALPKVARTGTHLFAFATYVQQFRGWGRSLRRHVARWYTDKEPDALAYQAVKYRQREGWTHRDLLRLAHPATTVPELRSVFDWIVRGSVDEQTPDLIRGFQAAQAATTPKAWADLVRQHHLTWEMLPDAALLEVSVWEALLDIGVPQTALLRQLPRLTSLGLLHNLGGRTHEVCAQLADPEHLRKARVHPISVLVAARTYASGRSFRGARTWQPVTQVVDALDQAFYAAFGAVTTSGKRTMLALDVSGSMTMPISGMVLTAREASAALALVQTATEPITEIVGFTHRLQPLNISPRQRLDDALRKIDGLSFGPTDCAQPMLYALRNRLEVDTFVIYTDNETWFGNIHPHQALEQYRSQMGIPAKLVVVGMTSTQFSIAKPDDPGMLDVAGFDHAVPNLIAEFSRGF